MKVKLEWLKELVDLSNISTEEIINKLSLFAIEVESVTKVVSGSSLVVGRVLTKEKHSDSDHLSLTTVDVGEEVLQIVCGAPNVAAGQLVVVAKVGAVLPGDFKIKKSKIRGVESSGMICSLNELGLEKKYVPTEYSEGIYYFKEEHKLGSDALVALNLADEVIELGLTPNRNDLLSMIGVAYEAAAVFNRPLKKLSYEIIRSKTNSKEFIEVINESNDCTLYYAQVIKNIKVTQSPWWLISRLIAFGIRPINNVVDITNYILALYGQPLHAFDFDKLGNMILVRKALVDEKITTLDGQLRDLTIDDLVITNGKEAVAIAGVMGGESTQITSDSQNIVIEAAVFTSQSVKATSNRLGLVSDSSLRFEKRVAVAQTKEALDYAAFLFSTLASGEVMGEANSIGEAILNERVIKVTKDQVEKLVGLKISNDEGLDILRRLSLKAELIKEKNNEYIKVTVNDRRSDLQIKEDIIEDIVKISGYSKLSPSLPLTNSIGGLTNSQRIRRNIKHTLVNLGLNELITYSLVSEKDNNTFVYNQDDKAAIELLMPLSNARRYLRKSLLPSLIDNANYAYSRKLKNLANFELSKVYYQDTTTNKPVEEHRLALLMSNEYSSTTWKGTSERVDFYLIKGVIENLLVSLNIGLNLEYKELDTKISELHPNVSAGIYIDDQLIGLLGLLHPKYSKEKDLDEVYVAEINLEMILNKDASVEKYKDYSRVPSVERDIAILVDKNVLASELIKEIKSVDKSILGNVEIFDIYSGEKIDSDKLSIAIKLEFTSFETLTDDVVNSKVKKILKHLENKFNAILRS